MITQTTSYNLEVQSTLWQGYEPLVPGDWRRSHRIQLLMAVDVLTNADRVTDETVAAAERLLEEFGDEVCLPEVDDGD